MSDRDDFVAAIAAALPESIYRVTHRAEIVTLNADDTLDLKVSSRAIEGSRSVPLRAGLPGARLLPGAGDVVRLAFEHGSPDGAYAFGFDQDPAADRGVAREGDEVDCGTITLANVSGSGIAFVYAPPGGVPTAATLSGPITVTPDPLVVQVVGRIVKGSDEVKLR